MNGEHANTTSEERDLGRTFLRDAVVFQGKLIVDGLRDLILFPVALVATFIDLSRGNADGKHGRRFYDVVCFGRQTERWIDLFEAADRAPETERPRPEMNSPTIDEFVNRFEERLSEKRRATADSSMADA